MEKKKIKFTDNPNFMKIVYGVIIATLCIAAIVIGIIAAKNNVDNLPADSPIVDNGDGGDGTENPTPPDDSENEKPEPEAPKKFLSPVSGTVVREHDLANPVFSTTLEEWRVHAGIDISVAENAPVFAVSDGKISKIYTDALLGNTVEITHSNGVTTVYSNLDTEMEPSIKVGANISRGQKIGTVGDTSLSEMADEAHLHFEVIENGKQSDPLNFISEEAKKASLGITSAA